MNDLSSIKAWHPSREAGRLRALRRSGLLTGGDKGQLERLADLARDVLGVPVVLISLCEEDRQVIAAQRGLSAPFDGEGAVLPLDSMCAEVLKRGGPFMTGDPDADRMVEGFAAQGADIAAYLGVPLRLSDGEFFGVLAATDRTPRRWREAEIGHLQSLAAILGEEIETRMSEAEWRALFEDMQESFYIAEAIRDASGRMADFRYLHVNPAFERMPGRANAVGRTVRELLPKTTADQVVSVYASVVEEGRPKLVENETDGEWYEVRARRLDDDCFAVTFHNISERKRAEIRLAEIEERRRLAIETGEVGIFDLDLSTRVIEWDERAAACHGLPGRTRVDFDLVTNAVQRTERAEFQRRLAALLSGEAPGLRMQYGLIGLGDGVRRWLFMNATVTRDAGGRALRLIGAVRDVSDRVAAEERRALLNAELSHRLKNTLAIVSSIVTQTLRSATDISVARRALSERIQALSKTHDILLSGQREAASVEAVVAAAVSIHDEEGRVAPEGPRLAIGPKASLTLSLIVNELATNAGKYGALSVPDGRVAAHWRIGDAGDGRTPVFVFDWREENGPAVAEPLRKGFGTRLIEMGLSGAAEASARIAYAPGGLTCRIVAPLAEIATADEAEAP